MLSTEYTAGERKRAKEIFEHERQPGETFYLVAIPRGDEPTSIGAMRRKKYLARARAELEQENDASGA